MWSCCFETTAKIFANVKFCASLHSCAAFACSYRRDTTLSILVHRIIVLCRWAPYSLFVVSIIHGLGRGCLPYLPLFLLCITKKPFCMGEGRTQYLTWIPSYPQFQVWRGEAYQGHACPLLSHKLCHYNTWDHQIKLYKVLDCRVIVCKLYLRLQSYLHLPRSKPQ